MPDPVNAQALILLSIKHVCSRTSLSRSTVYRLARDGNFPRPVEITPGRMAWIESEIAEWIAVRIEKARQSAA